MYKLTVVAGPNRGTSFVIQEGENWVGRQAGNVVVLRSSKISKRHCVLVVDNTDRILLKDQGSSNGTFVNGVLTKRAELRSGDRVSVGEYVLELSAPKSSSAHESVPAALPNVELESNVLPFPVLRQQQQQQQQALSASLGASGAPASGLAFAPTGGDAGAAAATGPAKVPKDLRGKVIWFFEHQLMPVFYQLNQQYEWKVLCAGIFGLFLIANLFISVYPVLTASRTAALKEVGRRAAFMAREIVDRNTKVLAERAETRADIGQIENAFGVRVAALTDLDLRIIAPGTRLNDYLSVGDEALMARRARDQFRGGLESGLVSAVGDKVIAIEPVKILNPSLGRNVVVAMAVVSIDSTLLSADLGEMGMVFADTLVTTALVAGFLILILYRLTLKPFQVLGDDMDKVLKGETTQVSRDYQFPEMDGLWDLINSALKRATERSSSDALGGGEAAATASMDDVANLLRALSPLVPAGLVLCDAERKILMMNERFEELSGIRGESAAGQDFASVARDQSLGAFISDLFDRAGAAAGGAEVITEQYEFSGTSYRVSCWALSASKGFLLTTQPTEGGAS